MLNIVSIKEQGIESAGFESMNESELMDVYDELLELSYESEKLLAATESFEALVAYRKDDMSDDMADLLNSELKVFGLNVEMSNEAWTEKVWDAIKLAGKRIWEFIMEVWRNLTTFINGLFSSLLAFFTTTIDDVMNIFRKEGSPQNYKFTAATFRVLRSDNVRL